MRWIALMLLVITGCEAPSNYSGSTKIEQTDGRTTRVSIVLPRPKGQTSNSFHIEKREEMDKLIGGLESLLLDLKQIRDRMPVIEPTEK